MSRALLLILTVFAVALAGLFYWTLTLSQRPETSVGSSVPGNLANAPDGATARLEDVERKIRDLDLAQQSVAIEEGKLRERVGELEKAAVERELRLAALARGEALPESASTSTDSVLRTAIEQVLDQRAAAERKQRVERMARGMTRFLLADIAATDAQKDEFVRIVAVYLEGRERIREASQDGVENPAQDAELTALEQKRDEELQAVFGANDFAKLKERLGRGPGGRPRGERRLDRNGFGPGRMTPEGGPDGR